MARITNGSNKNGKVGDLVYYKLNGKEVVRTIGKVSKSRYKKSKSFSKMRDNMSEFGAASMIGKVLRVGFSLFIEGCKDPYLSGRLNAVVRKVIVAGKGKNGRRSFEIENSDEFLKGFEFSKKSAFGLLFSPPLPNPELIGNSLIWKVTNYGEMHMVRAPKSATHFKLVLGSVLLSDYFFDEERKGYVPIEVDMNGVSTCTDSSLFSIAENGIRDIDFNVDLGFYFNENINIGVVISTGVVFYQEVNNEYYELGGPVAMKIVKVFNVGLS